MKAPLAIDPAALRRAAEERLIASGASRPPQGEADLRRLQQELAVHQIELEMQNEELRAAHAEIAAALDRYTDHFDFAPVGYFNLTADGAIQLVNLTGGRLLGIERARLLGRCLGAFVAEASRREFGDFLARVFATATSQTCELALERPGQPPLAVLLEATLSPDGKECRGVMVDVTERKLLEEKLRRGQRMEAIGTLASGIAHDLNNILTPITMGSGLLMDSLAVPHDRELMKIIQTSAERGANIIRQLLTFSRGITGARAAVQLHHLLAEMLGIMHETFPRNITLENHADSDLLPVMGDATQLHQVIMNLCVNARDAMPEGGILKLAARTVELGDDAVRAHPAAKPGPHVAITVADTGEGIPQEIIERIFDPFFTTKAVGKGTGLGLSTVSGIVRSHAGIVTVESAPGKGTTFTVYLPVAARAASNVTASANALPRERGQLILVVDDEETIRQTTQRLLEQHGYKVVTAGNGTEAIAMFQQHRAGVKLVLTDLMMPMMDGSKLIRALRDMDPKLRVIATSGLTSQEKHAELITAGVDCFLMKPCNPRELLEAIARQLAASE